MLLIARLCMLFFVAINTPHIFSGQQLHAAEKSYSCETCNAVFPLRGTLNRHMSSHRNLREFACSICGSCFNRSDTRDEHEASHAGEKPWVCPVASCRAAFLHRSDLVVHNRVHTDKRPYPCPYEGCDAAFKQTGTRTSHIRAVHTREKPYACPYAGCGATFTQPSTLSTHQRTHTKKKPFACPEPGCSARFAQRGAIAVHLRTHTGERPYECATCPATFQTTSHRARHAKQHNHEIIPSAPRTYQKPAAPVSKKRKRLIERENLLASEIDTAIASTLLNMRHPSEEAATLLPLPATEEELAITLILEELERPRPDDNIEYAPAAAPAALDGDESSEDVFAELFAEDTDLTTFGTGRYIQDPETGLYNQVQ